MQTPYKTTFLSGWNRFPIQECTTIRPTEHTALRSYPSLITRGQGRSYSDAALNTQGFVLLTERLNRVLAFDKTRGILTAESGITLAEIIDIILPAGWFLPVTPGTKFVSLGGCVAADVHGKNHHHSSSFSQYITNLEIITADNTKLMCSPSAHAKLFWATIGGMGLTGIISTVTLQLKRITTNKMSVRHFAANNLDQLFNFLSAAQYDDDYTVAWLDCLTTGKQFGRGIVMTAHHASVEENLNQANLKSESKQQINIPFNCPSWLLNTKTINLFNYLYFSSYANKTQASIIGFDNYFYPLDSIKNWNRLYGKNGFIQYQCVLPEANSYIGIKTILEKLTQHHWPSFLGVLKRFGPSSNGFLSFPMPGFTLAVDIPIKHSALFNFLTELDEIVINYGGRVYLAKDVRLSPEHFKTMYPNYSAWLAIKQQYDPHNYFTSSLAKRLKIGY